MKKRFYPISANGLFISGVALIAWGLLEIHPALILVFLGGLLMLYAVLRGESE